MSENIDKIVLRQGDFLCREGDDAETLFYVVSGVLSVMKRQGDSMVQVGTCYAGEVVGEMSFLAGEPRYATVKATGECEVLILKTFNLELAKRKLPIWVNTLVATMIERLNRQNNRIRI